MTPVVMAFTTTVATRAEAHRLGIEDLLLVRRERGIEGARGRSPGGKTLGTLGLPFLHLVQPLRRRQLGEFSAVHAMRRTSRRLLRTGKALPGTFLRRVQRELLLQRGEALGPVLAHALQALRRIATLLGAGTGMALRLFDLRGRFGIGRGLCRRLRGRRERSAGQQTSPQESLT